MPKTLEEVQDAVCRMEVDCLAKYHHVEGHTRHYDCLDKDNNPLPDCGGTGRVPRFPELRKPCNVRIRGDFGAGDPNFPEARGERHPENCPRCHGLGYVPSDDSWVLLACAFEWRFQSLKGATAAYCRLKPNSLDYGGHGSTHKEAAWHALLEACLNENS